MEQQLTEILANRSTEGGETLFALIAAARDALDSLRVPSVPCGVCLDTFEELAVEDGDAAQTAHHAMCTRECGHVFHADCLREYVAIRVSAHQEEVLELRSKSLHLDVPLLKVPCPVCRMTLKHDEYS